MVNQTKKNISVLVLDDQSTDGTQQILEEFTKQYSNIKVIQGKGKPEDWLGKTGPVISYLNK